MSTFFIEAIRHRYKARKRDAEQTVDFYSDIEATDENIETMYSKIDAALTEWIDADLRLGAIDVITGQFPRPFERETANINDLIQRIFEGRGQFQMPITNVGSKFFTESTSLTTTSQTTVYTVPPNYSAIVKLFIASNIDAAARNVTVSWYHADDASTHTIIGNHAVTGNALEVFLDATRPLYLHTGDILYATAATANVFEITVSVEEYYDPNRG